MSFSVNIPKNVLKRKVREHHEYLEMYTTVGALKAQLKDIPDDLEIEADYGYYEGDSTSFYVTIKSEESDEDYQDRIDTYVKRKTKEKNWRTVAEYIINYVKSNNSPSLDDVASSLHVFKGKKFGFRCSAVINELLADGYIYFNDDRTKVLFCKDLV